MNLDLSAAAVPPVLRLRLSGLTAVEVETSRRKHGANLLTPPVRDPWWRLYLGKFEDPVIRVLMMAALLAVGVGAVHGEYLEGIGIVVAILLATALAFANELRASREFDVLNRSDDQVGVQVLREGSHGAVPRKDLVVGDLVLIETGEAVPADGNLLESFALAVNEATLTGESLPVAKSAVSDSARSPERVYTADRLLRGTMVVDGHGLYRVTAVGDATEVGGVLRESLDDTEEVTPLQAQLDRLSKVIGVAGFGIAALTFAALSVRGLLTGELALTPRQGLGAALLLAGGLIALVRIWLPILYDARELAGRRAEPPAWLDAKSLGARLGPVALGAVTIGLLPLSPAEWLPAAAMGSLLRYFMIAVTIIVVAVPEGLAMSVTLSLAYSMRKMMASNTLVRRMHACETIGAATVICTDKTGTLTRNEMRVAELRIPSLISADFHGSLGARLLIEAIAANSTANLSARGEEDGNRSLGSPTEGALLTFLAEKGVDYREVREAFQTTGRLTFSTERKYMGTLGVSAVTGSPALHAKGAPELLLARCAEVLVGSTAELLDPVHRARIGAELRDLQKRGMRALGFAYRTLTGQAEAGIETGIEEMARSMIWLGFVALADPVRPDVADSLRACREAGIEVKIVTGDNAETAWEIGRQVELLTDGRARAMHCSRAPLWMTMGEPQARSAAEALARSRPRSPAAQATARQASPGERPMWSR